jgi:hypothetical protein
MCALIWWLGPIERAGNDGFCRLGAGRPETPKPLKL